MKTKHFFSALLCASLAIGLMGCRNTDPDYGGNGGQTTNNGMLTGIFSVSNYNTVHFSQGNLQYQASTNTWRFAERQYDVIGEGNANISSTYSGWIDLFGWGTGTNPTNTSTSSEDYSTFTDWGVNAISNGGNTANTWRTLTANEWLYLFHGRVNAQQLFGFGCVNGVNGIILLPDNWTTPTSVTFVASTTKGLKWQDGEYIGGSNNFNHNIYTAIEWQQMEAAGAVFLPAAGYRNGTFASISGASGYIWSSTPNDEYEAYYLNFYSNSLVPRYGDSRYLGQSVRLVH